MGHYGLILEAKSVWKSILLALVSVGIVYSVTVAIGSLYHVDFRIWVMAFKTMNANQFYIVFTYLLPFLLFFLINGLFLHGQLRLKESNSERKTAWKWFGANFRINAIGIIVLIIIQYAFMFGTGVLLWDKALLSIVAFQFVVVNFIVAIISTYLFRKTGTIYAGAFVNALLITWYIVAGQAMQF